MSGTDRNESNHCPHCGAVLPEGAVFCHTCASPLAPEREIRLPVLWKRRTALLAAGILFILILIFAVRSVIRNRTVIEGDAEAQAVIDGETWYFVLRASYQDTFHWTSPEPAVERSLAENAQAAVPSQLYVYTMLNGEAVSRKEAFLSLLEERSVTVRSESGTAPSASNPSENPAFPGAALESDIVFTGTSGENDIVWSLTLTDGRTVLLHQHLRCNALTITEYRYEDTPLAAMEDLKALLENVKTSAGEFEVIHVYLAPVLYEGDLVIDTHAVSLFGTSEGEKRTTFTGTIEIKVSSPYAVELEDIAFEGGGGCAVRDSAGFFSTGCTYRGYDTAIEARSGGYAMVVSSTFEDCGTGIHFQSHDARMQNALFSGNTFSNNGTAVLLEAVPGAGALYFYDCTFRGNGEDIVNHTEHEILTDGSMFE